MKSNLTCLRGWGGVVGEVRDKANSASNQEEVELGNENIHCGHHHRF